MCRPGLVVDRIFDSKASTRRHGSSSSAGGVFPFPGRARKAVRPVLATNEDETRNRNSVSFRQKSVLRPVLATNEDETRNRIWSRRYKGELTPPGFDFCSRKLRGIPQFQKLAKFQHTRTTTMNSMEFDETSTIYLSLSSKSIVKVSCEPSVRCETTLTTLLNRSSKFH